MSLSFGSPHAEVGHKTVECDRRLYKTEDGRIVEAGDRDARWLYATPGSQIPKEVAAAMGMLDTPAPEPESKPEPEPKPESKPAPKRARRPANKARRPAADKSAATPADKSADEDGSADEDAGGS